MKTLSLNLVRETTIEAYFGRLAQESGFASNAPQVLEQIKKARLELFDEAGGQIWEYDNIGMLSGSAGLCLVRNGSVIKYFLVKRA